MEKLVRKSRLNENIWLAAGVIGFLCLACAVDFYINEQRIEWFIFVFSRVLSIFFFFALIGFFINKREFSRKMIGICLVFSNLSYGANILPIFINLAEIRAEKAEEDKWYELISWPSSAKEALSIADENLSNKWAYAFSILLKAGLDYDRQLELFFERIFIEYPDCLKTSRIDFLTYRSCSMQLSEKLLLQKEAQSRFPEFYAEMVQIFEFELQRLTREIKWINPDIPKSFELRRIISITESKRVAERRIIRLIEYTEAMENILYQRKLTEEGLTSDGAELQRAHIEFWDAHNRLFAARLDFYEYGRARMIRLMRRPLP